MTHVKGLDVWLSKVIWRVLEFIANWTVLTWPVFVWGIRATLKSCTVSLLTECASQESGWWNLWWWNPGTQKVKTTCSLNANLVKGSRGRTPQGLDVERESFTTHRCQLKAIVSSVSWCFKPSQPQRITSGHLNTNVTIIPSYNIISQVIIVPLFWAYLYAAGTQHGNLHPAGWPILHSAGQHSQHMKKIGRGFGKNAGEWTGRVEISKEEIPGSKRSMYGYILTYSRLERENV